MAPGETACTHQHAQWPRTSHTREVLQKPNARPLGWLQGRQPHTDRNRQGGREVHLQLRAALYGLLENVMAGGDPAGSGGPDGAAGGDRTVLPGGTRASGETHLQQRRLC